MNDLTKTDPPATVEDDRAPRTRLIRQEFPDIGDGCYITIKNPRFVPASRFTPDRTTKIGPDGEPDRDDAAVVGAQWLLWFVRDWHMVPVITDDADWDAPGDWEPEPLGPPSVETMQQLPAEVEGWLVAQVMGVARPSSQSKAAGTT